ncbi:MAG TPA: patatin-like phospholipase family protein [Candidatus Acidoferrales bacterium]|jgi:patatin-like phospholipase/acyl hydrolase|nr:patatin-like phospholipase family protein [Candidatus Acidoferrales bacterium]
MTTDKKRINVLSIDGGGIRGIIPAVILESLQKALGQPLHEVFDLIAGTSTGGIIAVAIGTKAKPDGLPYAPSDLVKFYVEQGPAIFRKHWYTWFMDLFGPKYSAGPLEKVLQAAFRDVMFSTALTRLLISSYDLQVQLPFFFKSDKIIQPGDAYDWPIATIARGTSAAPTFFPPLLLNDADGQKTYTLVDGGIYVNNPAMAAFAEGRHLHPDATEFIVVAVGTGDTQANITYKEARKWGLFGWANEIIPVMMDGVSEAVDYELNNLPECIYHRLQVPALPPASNKMDDVSKENLANLQLVARKYVQANETEIAKIARELLATRTV